MRVNETHQVQMSYNVRNLKGTPLNPPLLHAGKKFSSQKGLQNTSGFKHFN